jgi:uncharacterized protein YjgD (DUF1641 family)
MAHQITFKPEPIDPQKELMNRIQNAPRDHAEALLAAWDLLEASHQKGILDLAQGVIGGRDIIAGKLAEAANSPDGINLARNLIALGRIAASIDPDMLYKVSRALDRNPPRAQETPPSLLSLFRQFRAEDTRRGLAYGLDILAAVGAATREP